MRQGGNGGNGIKGWDSVNKKDKNKLKWFKLKLDERLNFCCFLFTFS